MVFSFGLRYAAPEKARAPLKPLEFPAQALTAGAVDGFDGPHARPKTESEPSLRILALTYCGPLSNLKPPER